MKKSALSFVLFAVLTTLVVFAVTTASEVKKPKGQYLGAQETVYPPWFKQSFLEFSDDIDEATEQEKRVMILFHQDNCPYCNALVEQNFSQKDIETLMKNKFESIAINMWGDREVVTVKGQPLTEKQFATAFKVQFTPTMFFLDEKGKIALRLDGFLPPAEYKNALMYVIDKKESSLSYADYLATLQPQTDTGKGALIQRDFFQPGPIDLSKPDPRPVAVFFEQKNCPNCQTLHTEALQDKLTLELINQYQVIQLDMWGDAPLITPDGNKTTARDWATQLNIKYAPSIVLFDPAGEEIIRSEAFLKKFHTQSIFDYVLSGAYETEPGFQRYISARADEIREQGIDVDIWE